MQVGFDDAYEGPADTPGEITTFTLVWAAFVAVVFFYVFESLRREGYVIHLDNELSIADMFSHSFVSSCAFVLYSMTLGPPFNLWGVPEWLPFVGMAVFTLLVSFVGGTYIAPIVKDAKQVPQQQQQRGSLHDPLIGGSHPVSDRGDDEDYEDYE